MKLLHVVGARPNFPKLAPVYRVVFSRGLSLIVVHTGQHYDESLSGSFFSDLGIPAPDVNLEVGSKGHAAQTAHTMERIEPVLIAHEPTFYNHLDETGWLAGDPVYEYKVSLLKDNNIAVWRNHDYVHRLREDGVRAGVVSRLGWQRFVGSNPNVFNIQPTSLKALIADVKEKLGINTVRYIGELFTSCKKVLLLPGAAGGRNQISAIRREKPDVVLCGEISEWETAEYIRDARSKGDDLSLAVLGHIASEEPGSEFLAGWLRENVKGVPVTHVPAGNSLMFV